MNEEQESIREYEDGDKPRILALYKHVMGHEKSSDRFDWQYFSDTQGHGWISIAETQTEIVGQNCTMRQDINYLGERIIAGQSCDGMVSKNNRGKGLFSRLANHSYDISKRSNLQCIFGFPYYSSYHIHLKVLNWSRVANLKYYYYRFSFLKAINSKVDFISKYILRQFILLKYLVHKFRITKMLKHKDINIEVESVLPEGIEDLLREYNNVEVLSIWKDKQYLQWRYENHPEHDYIIHVLYILGIPEGLLICRKKNTGIAICEIFIRNRNVLYATLLLLHTVYYYSSSDAQKIEYFGYDNGFYDTIYMASGFNMHSSSPLYFCGRVFEEGKLKEYFPYQQYWTITYGDTDII